MSMVILVRHALSEANESGVLAGRKMDVHLSGAGKKQAQQLAKRLGDIPAKALICSPLDRCIESITPWFNRARKSQPSLRISLEEDLAEVDYGAWTGKKLRTLAKTPLWKEVQERPSKVVFPGGESMLGVQARATAVLERALSKRGKGPLIVVSHGDVIKAMLASVLNMSLDDFQRIVVDPASISILDFSVPKPRLHLMNDSRSSLNPNLFLARSKGPLVGGGAGPSTRERRK